ncbi:alpha-ketoglutarate-dependent dioxygenase AlkB [Pseudomonas sp. NPDC090202]|uniref:alpha-ketoglutarate-dependent dioxygenase AlkB n=1 Tax=unclassified Pseudomonas TaxID=196821 RepID=UPI0038045C59
MNSLTQPLSLSLVQNDLFGDDNAAFSVDTSFSTAKRIELDEHSWIEIVPGWASGAALLFEQMLKSVPWAEHERRMFNKNFLEPRLTAAYTDLQQVTEQGILQAVASLSEHYGVDYDGVWMNLYRSEADSTGWHRDYPSCRRPECVVPVLTLGATRRFQIKPYSGGRAMTFKPSSGDLIVMGGRAQQDWLHCVPKETGTIGARVSVNFTSSFQAGR